MDSAEITMHTSASSLSQIWYHGGRTDKSGPHSSCSGQPSRLPGTKQCLPRKLQLLLTSPRRRVPTSKASTTEPRPVARNIITFRCIPNPDAISLATIAVASRCVPRFPVRRPTSKLAILRTSTTVAAVSSWPTSLWRHAEWKRCPIFSVPVSLGQFTLSYLTVHDLITSTIERLITHTHCVNEARLDISSVILRHLPESFHCCRRKQRRAPDYPAARS